MSSILFERTAGYAEIKIFPSKRAAGEAAGEAAANALAGALRDGGKARIIVATGNSQLETVNALAQGPGIDWRRVEVFHMDEYAGLPGGHPAGFRRWVKEKLVDRVHPGEVHYIEGDAPDLEQECARYAQLLCAAPIDLCLLGIGENGHLAFNDPHVADFSDPLAVKRVTLDEVCRQQQVGEGHFPSPADVPAQAVTLTIPALMRAERIICSVPERRKAEAVRQALEGPVAEQCPASQLRTHPRATIYLDAESASLLTGSASPA